jgi:hypothetical protein
MSLRSLLGSRNDSDPADGHSRDAGWQHGMMR